MQLFAAIKKQGIALAIAQKFCSVSVFKQKILTVLAFEVKLG
jgi:hypothetical protein